MKKCYKCNIEKPLSEFHQHRGMNDGHQHKCKACAKLYAIKNKPKPLTPFWDITNAEQINILKGNFCEHDAYGIVATPSVSDENLWYIFRNNGVEVFVYTDNGIIVDTSHKLFFKETKHIIKATKQKKSTAVYIDRRIVYHSKM